MRSAPLFALVVPSVLAFEVRQQDIQLLQSQQPASIDSEVSNLTARGVTQCGPAYGNAVCDPSQCCSPDGACGTGGYYCFAPSCLFPYGPACDANKSPPGANTSSIPRPQFGKVPYGTGIYHCTTPGKVALTFDDGPWIYTSDLLDILKSNNVKATFFMVANNNGKGQIEQESTPWPAIMRRVLNEGHQLASHTWSHQDLSTLTAAQISDQVIKNEIAFSDVFGFFPTYLRPPYESCNSLCQSILGSLGYHVLNYDVDTLDWQENYANSRSIFSSAIKSGNPASNSYIPLTHDIHNGTVYGFVQYMIDTLRSQGYTTALVGECLADPPSNWYRDAKTGQQWSGAVSGASSQASSKSLSVAESTASSSTAQQSLSTSSSSSSSQFVPSSSLSTSSSIHATISSPQFTTSSLSMTSASNPNPISATSDVASSPITSDTTFSTSSSVIGAQVSSISTLPAALQVTVSTLGAISIASTSETIAVLKSSVTIAYAACATASGNCSQQPISGTVTSSIFSSSPTNVSATFARVVSGESNRMTVSLLFVLVVTISVGCAMA